MRITFDKLTGAAYLALKDDIGSGGVAKTYTCDPREVEGEINLDFDYEGRLIGIEVLDARSRLPWALLVEGGVLDGESSIGS